MEKLCPGCGLELNLDSYCTTCKRQIKVYKKAELESKILYNNGLDLAKVRDISGAIGLLQRSIKFDKNNIAARNLIGLLYFEIGETVLALRHWVISKSRKPSDNIASHYLEVIQDNQSHLERLNSAIKKFNQSLNYIKQDSVDLAVIHLKKVISLNPKFTKAYNLLALCYMKEKQDEKAIKVLRKVLLIDKSNYVARKYYNSLLVTNVEDEQVLIEKRDSSSDFEFKMPFSLSGSLLQFLALIFGVAIGFALVMVLIMPKQIDAKDDSIKGLETDLALMTSNYNDMKTAYEAEETLSAEYMNKSAGFETELETAQGILDETTKVLLALNLYMAGEDTAAANELYIVDKDRLTDPSILEIYEATVDQIYPDIAEDAYDNGYAKQRSGKYEEAVEFLETAVKFMRDADYASNAYYYLGKSYFYLQQYDLAKKQFEIVIANYPDSPRIADGSIEWLLGEIAKEE